MKSRWARPQELSQLQDLWMLCFGDEAALTACFFARFPPECHTRVMEWEGRLAAMASWLPMELQGQSGAYLYAVATYPEARGHGLCRTLMEELEAALKDQGLAFTALCPAEPSLYTFYGAMGYETAFYWGQRALEGKEGSLMPLSAGAYAALREEFLPMPHGTWGEAALSYLAATGTEFYRFPGGCAAVQEGRILELLGATDNPLGRHFCRAPGLGIEPRGMIKWLGKKNSLGPAYLGFAFD